MSVSLRFYCTCIAQEQDYPDKLANTPRTGAKRDTERCATLAAEIEASEGRKVELIKRKIIREGE